MNRWIKYWRGTACFALLTCLIGCGGYAVKSSGVCRIQFDYTDEKMEQLNTQNLRAVKSFYEVCNGL